MKCHLCKTEKQQTNHWFLVASMITAGIVILDYREEAERGWADSTQIFILCGESCVVKLVSQLMSDRNVARIKEQLRQVREEICIEETKHSDS
jgi:hypothetical protein